MPDIDAPWNAIVTGVGGTGVLTVTAMVAMAAHIEGKGCATMNQTGLAQKFGAVVSHVRVANRQDDIKAVRISAGEADLMLGCDLAVASGFEALAKVHAGRSNAVVNCAETPNAAFVLNPDAEFLTAEMQQTLREEVGEDRCHFIDSTAIATELLGDSIAGNLFLLGFAWQRGLVPVSREALERAIEINGVAVDFNKQAFLWGRRAAHEPEQVTRLVGTALDKPRRLPLDELVADRADRLTAYQNAAYARDYTDFVHRVREADHHPERELTRAVAQALHKLMAYKDEYEVARLYTDGAFRRRLRAQFAGDYKLRFHLAPPLLARRDPSTGHLTKREFPGWTLRVFAVLAKLRFLRGSAFDLFGRSGERRRERQDIADYRTLLGELLPDLTDANYAAAVQLAELPLQLRGFGHVKDDNRDRLKLQRDGLLAAFRGESPVRIVDEAA